MKNNQTQKIRTLILGSGGREFQMASSFSNQGHEVYVAPGNDWMRLLPNVQLVPIKPIPESFYEIASFVKALYIDLIIVGPEDPLCAGFVDFITKDPNISDGVKVIGPTAAAAQLEGSKYFAKKFMFEHGIPTAKSLAVTAENIKDGQRFMSLIEPPYVLKADGLAAGKGVIICPDYRTACDILDEMIIAKKFGDASTTVVIEEFLNGIEVSIFALVDKNGDYVILPEAKDYKRLLDGDKGPNTGGMGAVSPVPFFNDILRSKVEEKILKPTIIGMAKKGTPYTGFIFGGLMIVDGEPYVIEYNCRMGDPETIPVIDRIFDQFPDLMIAAAENRLKDFKLEPASYTSIAVVLASEGYPENPTKGKKIMINQSLFTHNFRNIVGAGVKMEGINHFTNGGRVCTVVCRGEILELAYRKVYDIAEQIDFEGMQYRSDIGADLSDSLVSESEIIN